MGMDNRHSSYPWTYDTGNGNIHSANNELIAAVDYQPDGHLMTAAPELLEALQGIVDMARREGPAGTTSAQYWICQHTMDVARAAIARAKGVS